MEKRFRRIISLVFCIILAFGLVACDGGEEKKTYSVIFVMNEDGAPLTNAPKDQTITEGKKATRPSPDPGRGGYTFGGWYEDAELTVEFDFTKEITARTFVYAAWTPVIIYYDVTFDYNYTGAPAAQTVEVRSGQSASRPGDPARAGFRFKGWSTAAAGTSFYNFAANVTGDLHLYAIWEKTYIVTFDFNYDGAPAAVTREIVDGNPASPPSTAGKGPAGWSFGGWYNEAACTTEYDFGAVTADKTVYAKWIDPSTVETTHTVTFDLNYAGAPAPETQEVLEGTSAERPADPERTNWHFSGWYTSASGGSVYGFGAVIQDRTVYARWAAGFNLDYNYADAPTVDEVLYAEGQSIPTPVAPTRAADPATDNGYTFVGWSTEPDSDSNFTGFGTPFTGNLTLYAQWRHKYVFEAEYTDLDDVVGSSISGSQDGPGVIVAEKDWLGAYPNADASNGYYLSYLYGSGIRIFFDVYSDRATTATFWVRLSNEFQPMPLTDENYLVKVNGQKVSFDPFYPAWFEAGSDYWWNLEGLLMPFQDYFGVTVQLQEGLNTVELIINNSEPVGGTLGAIAPVIDCIKFETTAALAWTPRYDNLERFLGEDWWLD